jgi:hypothetical protein
MVEMTTKQKKAYDAAIGKAREEVRIFVNVFCWDLPLNLKVEADSDLCALKTKQIRFYWRGNPRSTKETGMLKYFAYR